MRYAAVPKELLLGPFTVAFAETLGVSASALRSDPWRQVLRGVYAHRSLEETREFRLAAVRLVLPIYAVLVGLTAAWILGVDVRRESDLDVHVAFPKGKRIRNRPGLVVCQETLDPSDVTQIEGVWVTTPLRTAFDCARLLRGVERVVVVDALAHEGLVDIEDIRTYADSKRRLRNLRQVGPVLDLASPKAESPPETRVRVLLAEAGLTGIEPQWPVTGPNREKWRADLAFPDAMVIVEYDGAWHFMQRQEDERRRAAMRRMGWTVIVVSAEDYWQTPVRLIAEVADAVRRGRAKTR